jgi:hypothetical protein
MTSWIFIARSQAGSEYLRILPPPSRMPYFPTAQSGQITCQFNWAFHVLTTLATS